MIFISFSVNESLPVKVSAADIEENPQFIKLLTALSQHLTRDGMSHIAQQDLTEVSQQIMWDGMSYIAQQDLTEVSQQITWDGMTHIVQYGMV